jgi:hypothetical protein
MKRLVAAILIVAMVAALYSIMMPSITICRASARVVRCAVHISAIGKALQEYSVKYHGKAPPTLETLVSEKLIPSEGLICPITTHRYIYLGLPLKEQDSKTVVFFKEFSKHDDQVGATIFFADGHTKLATEEELQTALLETIATLRNAQLSHK